MTTSNYNLYFEILLNFDNDGVRHFDFYLMPTLHITDTEEEFTSISFKFLVFSIDYQFKNY